MQMEDSNWTSPTSAETPFSHRTTGQGNRRYIPAESGRAIEVLGHAIEYLSDEYALTVAQLGQIDGDDPQIEAIHLLMSANREVYYSCPVVEPMLRRLGRWALGRSQNRIEAAGKSPA